MVVLDASVSMRPHLHVAFIAVSSISPAQKGRTSFSSLSFLFQKRSISIVGLLAAQQLPLQLLDSKEKCCLYV